MTPRIARLVMTRHREGALLLSESRCTLSYFLNEGREGGTQKTALASNGFCQPGPIALNLNIQPCLQFFSFIYYHQS